MNSNQYIYDCVEEYRDKKDKWLAEFNKCHDVTSTFLAERKLWPPHKYMRKNPWYLLLKRESVPMCAKMYRSKKLNRTELMEGYVQHKVDKWIKKNPCPVQKDDIFYSQQFPIWDEQRQAAEEHIRDLVIAKYDKLSLVGRFETANELYKEQEIAQIRDDGETVKHNGVANLPESSKVLKKARIITNKVKAKRANLICTNLKDHKKKHGRILLPNANKELRIAA